MRVVVVGAYGLIGGYVAVRLQRDGHEVVGVGRDLAAARRRLPLADWIRLDLRRATRADWTEAFAGAQAVVNCAGALQDNPRDDLQAVHVDAVEAMAQACVAAGVGRFVHVSAAGQAAGRGRFARTKVRSEETLAASGAPWVILRPGLVLAPSAYGGSALLRGLAGFPGLILAAAPQTVVQTVWVDDIAEAVARAVRPDAPVRVACDLVAPEATSLGDILRQLRAWLGFAPAPILAAPRWLGWAIAPFADALAWLGWRSPLRSATVRQLGAGVLGRSADAAERLGFAPMSLAAALAAAPAGVQERWFARLYFVKPLTLVTLSGFWATSGIVGLANLPAAVRILTAAGFGEGPARALAIAGALADLALAAGVVVRRTAASALRGMVALTGAYLAAASFWTPGLWADPLGPLVKSVPAAVLALAALAMMEER